MRINFILNEEELHIEVDVNSRLVDLLRTTLSLRETKQGCLSGLCGSCLVFFNGEAVKACLVPVFRLNGSTVITIEYFAKQPEYHAIIEAFSNVGGIGCDFCTPGKIVATAALLTKDPRPSPQKILFYFEGIRCRCTEPDSLVAGVSMAADKLQQRSYEHV
ncbi:MAG: 2Fe-2S iron-sulfur cluster binding domain-containing protein [Treponema sp.]|jgi:carbon-monoxide dehydrogenase small subunit|nr:2Fe-2S iron-sulfur cluster binding domain-containing protein [Treponema sp.]